MTSVIIATTTANALPGLRFLALSGRRSLGYDGREFGSVLYLALKVKLTVAGFPAATVTV